MNYARRQQYRRLSRAGAATAGRCGCARACDRARDCRRSLTGHGADPHSSRLRRLRTALVFARQPEQDRSGVGRRGSASPQGARGRGLAIAALVVLAGTRGHRLGRDRTRRGRVRDRNERQGGTTTVTLLGSGNRRCGCRAAGEGGVATVPSRFCASCAHAECGAGRMMCLFSRSIS
jgi:hypothetical protein